MNNVNSDGFNVGIDSEISEAVPGEMGDIFTVFAVGNEDIFLIAFVKFDSVIRSFIVDFFSVVNLEFFALFGASENRIAYCVFSCIVELCFALILDKNGLEASDNLICR